MKTIGLWGSLTILAAFASVLSFKAWVWFIVLCLIKANEWGWYP